MNKNTHTFPHLFAQQNSPEISGFLEVRRVFNGENGAEKAKVEIQNIKNTSSAKELELIIKNKHSSLKKKINDTTQAKEKTNQESQKVKEKIQVQKDVSAGIDALKGDIEHEQQITAIIEKAEKFKSTLSVSHLLMLENIAPGSLKKLYTKKAEGERQEIDFAGNNKAQALIGLGDMLELSQTYVMVYDTRTGEWEKGVRGIKNTSLGKRPAYINSKTGSYIEVLNGYKVEEISKEAFLGKDDESVAKKEITLLKSNLQDDEVIFDEEITEKDIAKNNTAKEEWAEEVGKIQKGFLKGDSIEATKNINTTILGALKLEISKGEGGYRSFNRKKAGDSAGEKLPENITISQIQNFQKLPRNDPSRLFAVGKYQFTPSTLNLAIKDRGISPSQEFTPEIQEELFLYLIFKKRPILSAYIRGTSNNLDKAMFELACEFASIPLSTGIGKYDNDKAGNKAFGGKKRYQEIRVILSKLRKSYSNIEEEEPSLTDKALYPKNKDSALYLSPRPERDLSLKQTVENLLKVKGFPESIFIKNVTIDYRYTPKELNDFTREVNKQYKSKNSTIKNSEDKLKLPIFYIDNEGGDVLRIKNYPEISDKKEEFNTVIDNNISKEKLQKGLISIRDIEQTIQKNPKNSQKILESYAAIRIAQEKSLGLNSVTLVMDKGEKTGVIKSRGFNSSILRLQYAKILAEQAEAENMQVLVKHFPGHEGFQDPHKHGAGERTRVTTEMQTFIDFLEHTKDNKNITVMLGHIKISASGWNTNGLLASESNIVADKLRSINPTIKLITDDIGGMAAASTNASRVRKNAKKARITILN